MNFEPGPMMLRRPWSEGRTVYDLLAMGSRGDQGVAEQRVVPGEEGNRVVIGPDDVAWVVGVAGKGLADKQNLSRGWHPAVSWNPLPAGGHR